MDQIKKKMASLKSQQDEAEDRARRAEAELAETNAKAQAVSRPKLWTKICNGFDLFICFVLIRPGITM